MRHLERTASDRASPATSETREEVASSASDDSSMLFLYQFYSFKQK